MRKWQQYGRAGVPPAVIIACADIRLAYSVAGAAQACFHSNLNDRYALRKVTDLIGSLGNKMMPLCIDSIRPELMKRRDQY